MRFRKGTNTKRNTYSKYKRSNNKYKQTKTNTNTKKIKSSKNVKSYNRSYSNNKLITTKKKSYNNNKLTALIKTPKPQALQRVYAKTYTYPLTNGKSYKYSFKI